MRAIMTVGLPASGKTTFAQEFAQREGFEDLNLDDIRRSIAGDPQDQKANYRAICIRNRRLRRLAAEKKDVILSDTHAQARYRREIVQLLRELGYRVELLFFNVGEKTCLERNAQREKPVPPEVIHRMARQLRGRPPSPAEADAFAVIPQPGDPLLDEASLAA